eukprot:5843297-Pleurochrysis_carterae.AAC.1
MADFHAMNPLHSNKQARAVSKSPEKCAWRKKSIGMYPLQRRKQKKESASGRAKKSLGAHSDRHTLEPRINCECQYRRSHMICARHCMQIPSGVHAGSRSSRTSSRSARLVPASCCLIRSE